MKGTIKIESKFEQGSRFIVTLPFNVDDHSDYVAPPPFKQQLLKRRKKVRSSSLESKTVPQAGKIHILVVEDSPVAMKMITQLLSQELDCTFETVYSGEAGVEFASTHPYALILMDIGLPIMQGDEATKAIRALK